MCHDILRISSVEEGKRFYGRPSHEVQSPGATIFICEESGPHDIHHQVEELEDGTCIDIYWAGREKSQHRTSINPLLVGRPVIGKWLPRQTKSAKINKEPQERKVISAEDW